MSQASSSHQQKQRKLEETGVAAMLCEKLPGSADDRSARDSLRRDERALTHVNASNSLARIQNHLVSLPSSF